jgi:3-hydroxyacyl-CoA dehydrogenase
MKRKIEKVAVLGAGIMGTGIAAHLANCRIPCYLLDIVPKELSEDDKKAGLTMESPAFRNKFSQGGVANAIKNKKPIPAFYHDSFASLITCGNFEDNMEWLKECDWVVEVVVENIDIKRKLLEKVEKNIKPGAIVSSNTSGLPIKAMVEGRSAKFRKNFLVTHFFNPVRFMRLLEIIGGADTDPEVVKFMADFGQNVLGKGIVYGFDSPNFVANRIGVYGMARTLKEMLDKDYSVEEVDAILGEPMGRPKTAAFRTIDMVGLDTVVHVIDNCYQSLTDDDERDLFKVPDFVRKMVEKKWLGNKTKGGFYKKQKGSGEGDEGEMLVIDPKTLEYRPKQKVRIDSLGAAKNTEDLRERVKNLLAADDRAGQFAWPVFRDTLIYSGKMLGKICEDVVQIDNGMKWGYNWSQGPFEAWDAVGFDDVCQRMEKDGKKLPPIAQAIRKIKGPGFYKREKGKTYYFDLKAKKYMPMAEDPLAIRLPDVRDVRGEVAANAGATLYDLGDGVLCCEFHTKMNSIDADVLNMLNQGIDLCESDDRWIGMVIGNHGENFCVGANLMLVFMVIQQANAAESESDKRAVWAQLEAVVKQMQDTCQRLKYSKKPTVAAPFGMTLGGGMEISMGADRICAHADLFMGQVELGVGLIPGGGGTKELLIRNMEGLPENIEGVNLIHFVRQAFEAIGMAKVSMSAHEAQALKFLRPSDKIVTNKDQLIGAAKRMVQAMHLEGYQQPLPRTLRLPGEMGFATFKMVIDSMCKQHQITPHEQVMAEKLAWVLCGGKTSPSVPVSEQYVLDLEREAFLSLCGHPKSQERMQHFLLKGKPLRN